MRKFVLGIFFIVVTFVLADAFLQRHALACELLPVLNYQQIDSQVFLGADISSERAESIRGLITSASERIEMVYGAPASKPRMLVTSNSKLAAKWGANDGKMPVPKSRPGCCEYVQWHMPAVGT